MKNLFKYLSILLFSTLISAEVKEHQGILATYMSRPAEYYANSINVYRSAIDKRLLSYLIRAACCNKQKGDFKINLPQ